MQTRLSLRSSLRNSIPLLALDYHDKISTLSRERQRAEEDYTFAVQNLGQLKREIKESKKGNKQDPSKVKYLELTIEHLKRDVDSKIKAIRDAILDFQKEDGDVRDLVAFEYPDDLEAQNEMIHLICRSSFQGFAVYDNDEMTSCAT